MRKSAVCFYLGFILMLDGGIWGCSNGNSANTTSSQTILQDDETVGASGSGSAAAESNSTTTLTTPLENMHVVGRSWDDGNGLIFGWSATSIEAHFIGTGVNARIDEVDGIYRYATYNDLNYYQITVDGVDTKVIQARNPNLFLTTSYQLANDLVYGEHTVKIRKMTEANIAASKFFGFEVVGGEIKSYRYPVKKHLLVIGDSLSAGYGDLGANPNCTYTPASQNGILAYGPVAAAALDAEVQVVAWSGRGMARNNDNSNTRTMHDVYLTPVLNVSDAKWDFQSWIPDAIAINLGTNDFSAATAPVESEFVGNYTDMVKTLLGMYPNAHVFCIVGPTMSDDYTRNPNIPKPYSELKKYIGEMIQQVGSDNVTLLEFPSTLVGARLGCDYHPNTTGQANMAQILQTALSGIGW